MAKKNYDDNSLKQLKGPDQVRLRPGVIFGSDGLDGCCHSVFEILSNSIDEAREGFGKKIIVTRFLDKSIEVQDYGRGIPIDFNKNEEKYNWELAFCTLYAGGKYDNNSGDNYSYSLGLNGLGLCSTQFAAEYMEVESNNGTWIYDLRFEKGYNVEKEERGFRRHQSDGTTGTKIKWKPDLDVFTDIDVPFEYFDDVLRRQAVVNDGLTFVLRNEVRDEETGETHFEEHIYCYENGISDYLKEIVGDTALTTEQVWSAQRTGKDREDKPEYKVKMKVAFVFSNKVQLIQHYHNSSWLEHGGSPDKAMQAAFTNQIDGWLKANSKYNKTEGKIKFTDIADCLVFISSNFSTQTSYENQTKKSITNKFIQEAMTDWLKHQLEVYFLENPDEAVKICEQVLINKRARENAAKARDTIKKQLSGKIDLANRIPKFVDCRSKDTARRELYIVEGDSALGAVEFRSAVAGDSHRRYVGVLPDGPPGGYLPSQMARTGYGYGSFRGEFPAGGFCGAGGVVAESAFRPLVVVAGFYFAHTTDVRLRTVPQACPSRRRCGGDARRCLLCGRAFVDDGLSASADGGGWLESLGDFGLHLHYLGQRCIRLPGGGQCRPTSSLRADFAQQVVGGVLRRHRRCDRYGLPCRMVARR